MAIDSAKSKLFNFSGEYSLGHPLVWLGITILLLVIGALWLTIFVGQGAVSVTQPAVKKLSPSAASAQTAKIAEAAAQKQSEMVITRENDGTRAEEYLEIEAVESRILPLLDSADVHFENEQYVVPAGANAWEDYQAILAIQPNESVAVSGLTKVKSKLFGNAEQAIDSGDYADAENWLVQLDSIQPGNSMQSELRDEISVLIAAEAKKKIALEEAQETQKKIQIALDQAEVEKEKKPTKFNIIKDLYDRVLELEEHNAVAKDGLSTLSDLKLDEAEEYLKEGSLEQVKQALIQAQSIYPENKRIGSLNLALSASLKQELQEEEIAAAKKLEQQKIAEAQQKKEQEQEKQSRPQSVVSAPIATTSSLQPRIELEEVTKPAPIIASGTIGATNNEKKSRKRIKNTLNQGIQAYYDGDYNRSFELLFPLAQEGIPRAQFRIGIMYRFGRSVSQNLDLAEKWFTSALPQLLREAQSGAAWAQTDLGTAYEFGIALQQDYERAAFWYQKAANQGYAGAQTNLGVLYAQGDGVDYDRSKAISWLRKAALQGDQVASDNLRILGVTP